MSGNYGAPAVARPATEQERLAEVIKQYIDPEQRTVDSWVYLLMRDISGIMRDGATLRVELESGDVFAVTVEHLPDEEREINGILDDI